ncbi:MAG TPA: thioredoxin family protein [Chthoniobacterales bacterium]|jgi:thiol:disulfide interchange protein
MPRLLVFLFAWVLLASPSIGKEKPLPQIYDQKADGTVQISQALARAKQENKHVLIDFGANWCAPCHELHAVIAADPAIREKLAASFVIVMIDSDRGRNEDVIRRYGTPTLRGLPVLAVLDPAGNHIFTQETTALREGEKFAPPKVLAFLNKW